MYVVVRSYKIDLDRADEVISRIQEGFLPIIQEIPGFVSYYGIKTQRGIATVSVFCSKSGIEESIRTAADFVGRNLSSILSSPPEILSGDAEVQASAVDEMAVCR
jgi:hypothetical protein